MCRRSRDSFSIAACPATKYGVLGDYSRFGLGMVANRWTFYIGPDGRILDIDKQVKPASSGEDAVAKLKALNVPLKKG